MTTRDGGRVQRWASILTGAAVVGVVGYMTIEQTSIPRASRLADAGADPDATAEASEPIDTSAAEGADGGLAAEGADAALPSFLSLDMGDASLPQGAPRSVRLGVVLVQWQGAEGATTSSRSKSDALAKAQGLADEAKNDFRRAVTQGDPGSAEDIGRIPRGTLDPKTESAVFNLGTGEVSGIVETPRGYWIVKRID